MSSAIYADKDGTIVVGRDAERRARLDPSRFEPNPKRRIDEGTLQLGDHIVPVADAFAAVLRRVGEEAERWLGRPVGQVRIAHPARWGTERQAVLRQATFQAGLGGSPVLIPEPVAAAAHYAGGAAPLTAPIAVYDLGAGTFDCAVVGVGERGFTVLAEAGLPDLGSLDIDRALLMHIGREVSHSEPARWQSILRPKTVSDRRTRRALLQDVRDAKESLSRHAQTEVYLVGGPSRMPLLASLLASQLGITPTTQNQPESAVAFGLHQVPLSPVPVAPPWARATPQRRI
jgi:molecular chaperone DnaK